MGGVGDMKIEEAVTIQPSEVLQQFKTLFALNGWTDQPLKIKYQNKNYRILCNDRVFMAYRVNDSLDSLKGISGWPVCIVDKDQIIDDSQLSGLGYEEPAVNDWLNAISARSFESI
jgi:hypothetical protein